MLRSTMFFALGAALLPAAALQAQTIFAPVAGVVSTGGTAAGTSLADTWNQDGLLTGYTANVTNFDAYLAGNPLHRPEFDTEWFSEQPREFAIVIYDFGMTRSFDMVALWNEDGAGPTFVNFGGSNDGVSFSGLGTLFPTNHPPGVYGADLHDTGVQNWRYVSLLLRDCPQTDHGFQGCSIGEIAFRSVGAVVPEPAAWALMLSGFGLAGVALRRRTATLRRALA